MTYIIELTDIALSDIEKHKKSGDQIILKRIHKIFNELTVHPTTGTGQPKKLKHDLQGYYSRRINKKHRIIYCIQEEVVTVLVISAYGHYGDR